MAEVLMFRRLAYLAITLAVAAGARADEPRWSSPDTQLNMGLR
jgi:hypothetical protein